MRTMTAILALLLFSAALACGAGAGAGGGGNGGGALYPPPGQTPPAEKPTLVAMVFEVLITDDQGSKQKDRLIFDDHKLACSLLTAAALGKIPYEEKPGATIDDPIPWSALGVDTLGDKVMFNGKAEKDDMSGTITLTPAQGRPHTFTFVGGKAGTDAARKAVNQKN
jgi:hypothetical protein